MGDDVGRREDGAESRALERVSDADRERAAEFVRTALGDGRIGLDEIDERLGAVLGARTRGDLAAALVHLPGADAVLAAAEPVPATRRAGEPVTITGTHARMQRSGRWEVPAHLVVTLVHSSLVLDLTEADLPGPLLRVDADLTHSRLRLIVPDDIRVEATDLDEHGSKVRFEPARNDTPPRAVVRVTGRLQWSKVSAAAPGRGRRRLLRRADRRP
ncbi:DUF1707 domain-containing protein [Jiangella sp. DSM 45060]|uniref:DUF1707 SHOCT-like domain-containing protein n=1 Tax=Jiangella sp. DSM 45060 TaxID=1798224 RepID=UPI00087BE966|nr:DUF1707 domain-containing protein [Jiangella sp. DSM 45060]SDT12404.1 protein of unknown function [Jiangella sp. DSM 45060]